MAGTDLALVGYCEQIMKKDCEPDLEIKDILTLENMYFNVHTPKVLKERLERILRYIDPEKFD